MNQTRRIQGTEGSPDVVPLKDLSTSIDDAPQAVDGVRR